MLVEKISADGFHPVQLVNSGPNGELGSLWGPPIPLLLVQPRSVPGRTTTRGSNVESTFSMIKAKFRDHVRSKTDTAMKNEVLCKFLCAHTSRLWLIQSQCELGIAPVFWGDEPIDENPDVLPLIRPAN